MDYPTPAQKASPAYCWRYARKTPMIPFHNGWDKCLGCGKVRQPDGTWKKPS